MDEQRASSRYWVPMVGHTFRAIEIISNADKELSLQEVSDRAGITKSSTFRILFTLEKLGYINRNPQNGKYQLGLKILEMAQKLRAGQGILQVARPIMEKLQLKFGETVNLATLQNGAIVYLEIIEGSHAFRMTGEVGTRAPLHASAVGKVLAAYLPEVTVQTLLADTPLPRLTPNTITNRNALLKMLLQIRNQGFAMDAEEVDLGASCVAMPIFTDGSQATYALSLSGPTARVKSQQKSILAELTKACQVISEMLKY